MPLAVCGDRAGTRAGSSAAMFGSGARQITPRGGKGSGSMPQFGGVPPNQTLYVQGLNEKMKIPELKCCLYELFSTYGEVIDVVAAGSQKKKGFAHVVFRDITCATNALRAMQNFNFLDKPMKLNYARSKSDVIALEDGTFKPRNQIESGQAQAVTAKAKAAVRPKAPQTIRPPPAGSDKVATPKAPPAAAVSASKSSAGPSAAPGEQPSNVLFVENLPQEVNEMMLTMLFRQYPGFQEARLIKGRNVAFIEYADELQAGIAKHGLQGFMVTPEMALKINFAKQ